MNILIDIDVPDLRQGIDFYCAAFDLRLNRLLNEDVAELVGGSSVIYLLEKAAQTPCAGTSTDRRRYARHWTPLHLDFVVKDLEQATARVIAAGATRESDCIHWRGSRCVSFADPFGHGFCLIAFEGDSYSDEAV